MARTRKPCHGCGQAGGYRLADEVCGECRRLIQAGQLLEKQQNRKFGEQYVLPRAAHCLPYIPAAEWDERDEFQAAFLDLCIALSVEPAKCDWKAECMIPGSDDGYNARGGSVYLESATCDSLRSLYASVQSMVEQAHAAGREEGEHFIRGLCSGDVSLHDLNESTIGGGDDT